MDLGLQGKKAIVCAASKGLGRASAISLARGGVELVITARTASTLEETAAEIRRMTGAKVTAVAGDIATIIGNSSDAYAGAGNYDFAGILEAMQGSPVTIRLLDPPLHEFLPSLDDLRNFLGVKEVVATLASPTFDPLLVHPKIRDFYERTPSYRFDTWATTYFPARLAL